YLAIFLVILVLAYTKNLPGYLNAIPYYDKIGHVVLYCVAAAIFPSANGGNSRLGDPGKLPHNTARHDRSCRSTESRLDNQEDFWCKPVPR
ncbi:MAG: hypothetical protein AAFW84_27110, partial [Cyanobacteria bacterium J06635_15]